MRDNAAGKLAASFRDPRYLCMAISVLLMTTVSITTAIGQNGVSVPPRAPVNFEIAAQSLAGRHHAGRPHVEVAHKARGPTTPTVHFKSSELES